MSVKVTRQVMIDNFDYFKRMFAREKWLEHDKTVIDMECDHPLAATLWFHAVHEGEVPDSFTEMPIEEVWEVIGKYNLRYTIHGYPFLLEAAH